MKTTITLSTVAAALLMISSTGRADEASHRQAAEDLLNYTNAPKQFQNAIDQSVNMQVKANPQLAPKAGVLKKFFSRYMSWDSMKDDMIKIYTDAFSEQELKELTDFYKSPIGKKVLEKMPEIMGKGMQLGVSRVQRNQAELIRMLKEDSESDQNPAEVK